MWGVFHFFRHLDKPAVGGSPTYLNLVCHEKKNAPPLTTMRPCSREMKRLLLQCTLRREKSKRRVLSKISLPNREQKCFTGILNAFWKSWHRAPSTTTNGASLSYNNKNKHTSSFITYHRRALRSYLYVWSGTGEGAENSSYTMHRTIWRWQNQLCSHKCYLLNRYFHSYSSSVRFMFIILPAVLKIKLHNFIISAEFVILFACTKAKVVTFSDETIFFMLTSYCRENSQILIDLPPTSILRCRPLPSESSWLRKIFRDAQKERSK